MMMAVFVGEKIDYLIQQVMNAARDSIKTSILLFIYEC